MAGWGDRAAAWAERGQRPGKGVCVEHISDRGQHAKLAKQAGVPGGPGHPFHYVRPGGIIDRRHSVFPVGTTDVIGVAGEDRRQAPG